ncbi:MAG: hypothetical protein CM1200mP18_10810 [Gammaproteobacteria bacterium]|nr:MAG: hypothetical protein CM1200mP18_10810 [Gammaproteobacteria bacterium]
MLAPVLASSLTTFAAFMPLLLVGGIIGIILRTSHGGDLRYRGLIN